MKKKLLRSFPREETLKAWRIMRLLMIFSFCFAMTVSASSYSQNTKLNLDLQDVLLKDALNYIEQNSEFIFLYKNDDLDVNKRVDINLQNASINEVLGKILEGQGVTYKIIGRQVVITTPGNPTSSEASQTLEKVTGKVTDSSGAPLLGVTVVIKGTVKGTITDSDGNYSISGVPSNSTLVFSFVGMKSKEIPVTGRTTVNAELAEETIGLGEVVAVGYGVQKKATLSGSVTSVQGDELAKTPVTNVSQSIAGRMPGVVTMSNGG